MANVNPLLAMIESGVTTNLPGTAERGGGGFFQNFGTKFSELTKDRNFLSMLAGIGTRLDPTGAGGAIGVPTQQMIQSLGAQEALTAGEAKRDKFNQELLRILGGLTPKELEGPTSLKASPTGVTLDITPPGAGGAGGPAAPAASTTGGGVPFTPTPGVPIAPGEEVVKPKTNVGAGREFNFSDLYPF